MLYYNIIDVSAGIGGTKQVHLSTICHNPLCATTVDVLMMSIDIAIDTVLLF